MGLNDKKVTGAAALKALQEASRPDRILSAERFFKTYPGGYSEGDVFLAVSVPVTRQIAKESRDLPLSELALLIQSKWHDARLLALIILVERYKRVSSAQRHAIYDFAPIYLTDPDSKIKAFGA